MGNTQKKDIFEALDRIQRNWGLSSSQMADLVHVSPEVYSSWLVAVQNGRLDQVEAPMLGTAESLLVIYQRISERFPKQQDQIRWLYAENQDFGGARPIDVASSSTDNMVWLGYYLSAQGIASKSLIASSLMN